MGNGDDQRRLAHRVESDPEYWEKEAEAMLAEAAKLPDPERSLLRQAARNYQHIANYARTHHQREITQEMGQSATMQQQQQKKKRRSEDGNAA